MKKFISQVISLTLTLTLILCLAACEKVKSIDDPWKNAIFTEDAAIGEGSQTFKLEVKVDGKSVELTISTDKETLGAALLEHGLIEGNGDGLYPKVNGMVADYNTDKTYWGFYIDGQFAMQGIDDTQIRDGASYRLVKTK